MNVPGCATCVEGPKRRRRRAAARLPMRFGPLVLGLVLGLPLVLSGCTDEAPEPEVLLQDVSEFGEDLYSWGDAQYTKPGFEGSVRRVRADLVVPGDISSVGVSFLGDLRWPENSTAFLNVTAADGEQVVTLRAEQGRDDDHGTIGSFWTFRREYDIGPGEYEILLWGTGNIGHIEFEIRSIPAHTPGYEQRFDVERSEGRLVVDLHVRGWGDTPPAALHAPDGTRREILLDGADAQGRLSVPAQEGTYRLEVDTAGWAGTVIAHVVHE